MALSMHVGRAIHSLDFIVEKLIRLVKAMQDLPEDQIIASDLPDLLKDIAKAKMTRCEIRLDTSVQEVNGQCDVVSQIQASPGPCTATGGQQQLLPFDRDGHQHQRMPWPAQEDDQDVVSLQQDPNSTGRPLSRRRYTEPTVSHSNIEGSNSHLEDAKSVISSTEPMSLNISPKKPENPNPPMSPTHDLHPHSEFTKDLVLALRAVGDSLDRKIDKSTQRNLMQTVIRSTVGDCNFSLNFKNKRCLKETADFCMRILSDYSRL